MAESPAQVGRVLDPISLARQFCHALCHVANKAGDSASQTELNTATSRSLATQKFGNDAIAGRLTPLLKMLLTIDQLPYFQVGVSSGWRLARIICSYDPG